MGLETALAGTWLGSALGAGEALTTASLLATPVSAASMAGIVPAASASIGMGTIMSAVSGISSVLGGIDSVKSAGKEAAAAKAEAELRGKEQARQAVKAAGIEKQQMEDVIRRQKLAYMASGVSLEGSPLLVMEDTRRKGYANIDEILSAGGSGVASSQTEGRIAASKLKTMGRKEFIGGLTTGLNTLTALSKA